MNTIFTADFTAAPNGPLYDNHPTAAISWGRRAISPETEPQLVFTSPVISGGAAVAVPGDISNRSVTAFTSDVDGDFEPVYPVFYPDWAPSVAAADSGELEVRFTLSAVVDFFDDGTAYEPVIIGCIGSTYTNQPFFSFGYDTYLNKPQIRFSAWSGVTPSKITLPAHLDLLLFGGAVNIAKIVWDRSYINFMLAGTIITTLSTLTRPTPNPTFEVREYGRVLLVSAGTETVIPDPGTGFFWGNMKNAFETL